MNTRKTFCPGRAQEEDNLSGKKPKACRFETKKTLNPAKPGINNIESSETGINGKISNPSNPVINTTIFSLIHKSS